MCDKCNWPYYSQKLEQMLTMRKAGKVYLNPTTVTFLEGVKTTWTDGKNHITAAQVQRLYEIESEHFPVGSLI